MTDDGKVRSIADVVGEIEAQVKVGRTGLNFFRRDGLAGDGQTARHGGKFGALDLE